MNRHTSPHTLAFLAHYYRLALVAIVIVMVAAASGATPARAQSAAQDTASSAICVQAFRDANANQVRDPGEGPLPGITVTLATQGAIVATHVTGTDETQHCFEGLPPGIYTIAFPDNALYRATTAREGTFQLDANQRLTIDEFGAVLIGPAALRAELTASDTGGEPLETPTRLLLATGGSMMVMLFMVGIGAVILGMASGRRAQRARQAKLTASAFGDDLSQTPSQ